MSKNTGNPDGRPTDYTKELGEQICELISNSEKGLHTLRKEHPKIIPGITTLFRWLDTYEDFRKSYSRAREAQAEFMRDSILEIADNSDEDRLRVTTKPCDKNGSIQIIEENKEFVNRSKLRVDTRLKLMAKLWPKVYGLQAEKGEPEDTKAVVIKIVYDSPTKTDED